MEIAELIQAVSEIETNLENLCAVNGVEKHYPEEHSDLYRISGDLGAVIQDLQFKLQFETQEAAE